MLPGIDYLDMCCFSYVATSRLMKIAKYPSVGAGAEILSTSNTISADGPIVAIAASRLGLKSGLISNSVGIDESGKDFQDLLQQSQVTTNVKCSEGRRTPLTVVFSDDDGTRTWFSHLPGVADELLLVDLNLFKKSKLAYVDLYPVIWAGSVRAIDYASTLQIPLYVNIGGAPLSVETATWLQSKKLTIFQSNVDSFNSFNDAEQALKELSTLVGAEITVLTLGERGCIAWSKEKLWFEPAYKISVASTNGAGATFSAAFAYAYLNKWDLTESLKFANAAGALNCTEPNGFKAITLDDTVNMVSSNIILS